MDIAAWLRGLGLERYEPAFRDNSIDPGILPKLTAEDLKDLGVAGVGDHRLLLEAIALLREGAAPLSASEKPPEVPVQRLQEDLRAVIGACHRCTAAVIERNSGFVGVPGLARTKRRTPRGRVATIDRERLEA
jgi:SAM domain (Sterile alpha motif)